MSEIDYVFLNGGIVPRAHAVISPLDRGFLYGDGFFETTRILDGVALWLDRHLDRLAASCRETGFGTPVEVEALRSGVERVIEANEVRDGYLRITLSRGVHRGELADLEAAWPTTLVQASSMDLPPLDSPPPLVLAGSRYRIDEHSPLVRHKSLSYQANLLALAEARRAGADEVFLLNSADQLTEGAISNLFFVKHGSVCTPDVSCGLLPGITREVVLGLCAELTIPFETRVYGEEDIWTADLVFCTNSLRGIMPVERIVGPPDRTMPAPGETTGLLQQAYADLARSTCKAAASGRPESAPPQS
jgi:branched-subunit amino acid aminotransferase/4-amino-4-deoxychorismate lyase